MFHHNSGKSPSKYEQELVKFKGSFVYRKAFFWKSKGAYYNKGECTFDCSDVVF